MIKIGLIGVGRMGTQHLERLLVSPYFRVIGCYDQQEQQLLHIEEEFGVTGFRDVEELIQQCDAIDIITPTDTHLLYAEKAIKYGKHVFVEKPISTDIEKAKRLVELVREANIIFQVGHIERFNPAFLSLREHALQPMLIEAHRLTTFDAKQHDQSVVLDLMMHDIDIVLHTVAANIKSIHANGVSVLSDDIDIANARIEFDNGCVANLTASRVSGQKMRKMDFFEKEKHYTLDFLHRETALIHLSDTAGNNAIPIRNGQHLRFLNTDTWVPEEYDALKEELNSFAECLIFNREPIVTAIDGLKTLEVASEILHKIHKMNGHQISSNQQHGMQHV